VPRAITCACRTHRPVGSSRYPERFVIVSGIVGKGGLEPTLALIECFDYPFYNTLDVLFYASFALSRLWPHLELQISRAFATTVELDDPTPMTVETSGERVRRKVANALPHDLGGPAVLLHLEVGGSQPAYGLAVLVDHEHGHQHQGHVGTEHRRRLGAWLFLGGNERSEDQSRQAEHESTQFQGSPLLR